MFVACERRLAFPARVGACDAVFASIIAAFHAAIMLAVCGE
jgi:hypothetical protein